MVRNGYKIKLAENESINDCIFNLRNELREKTYDITKKLIAIDIEHLWDAKFIDGCQYDDISILELAVKRVKEKMDAIARGNIYDGRYDMRSTINIVNISDGYAIVLFNTLNDALKEYFESIDRVSFYKYYADDFEEDITKEENDNRGLFWQNEYEKCNWKTSLLGLSAQLTLQPDLEDIVFSTKELKECFRPEEERMKEYIESRIVIERVRLMLGDMPIEQISPVALEEFFREGYAYLRSPNGLKDYKKNVEKIGCGFIPIDTSALTLK